MHHILTLNINNIVLDYICKFYICNSNLYKRSINKQNSIWKIPRCMNDECRSHFQPLIFNLIAVR